MRSRLIKLYARGDSELVIGFQLRRIVKNVCVMCTFFILCGPMCWKF